MWIDHPACGGPVSLGRWIRFHLGTWMQRAGADLENGALYPDRIYCPDCGQLVRRGEACDHLPF